MSDDKALVDQMSEVPEDDDLWGDLRWEDLRDSDDESAAAVADSMEKLERFIHDRTGTEVDIYRDSDGDYSVQAKLGGYNNDAVIQPDETGRFVSATTSVLDLGEPTIEMARAIAFSWIRGWAHRNNTYHDQGYRDLERRVEELPEANFEG